MGGAGLSPLDAPERNTMKLKIIVAAAVFLPIAARAADAPPAPQSSTLMTLDRDWQAYNTQQAHVFDDILALAKENTALKAENDKLKADAAKSDADTKAKPNPSPSPTK